MSDCLKHMTKKFLHVGCGPQNKTGIKGFSSDAWTEIRFDIDENVKPDIIGTLTDMKAVSDNSVDAVFSSHNIEHVYAHEVIDVLKEFRRVLKDDGFAVITCPDLQSVCEAVANDKLLEPLYVSQSGPISPIDILYGHRGFMQNGNTYMAHKCGFTFKVLVDAIGEAGFSNGIGTRRPKAYDLWAVAFKAKVSEQEMQQVARQYLP